MDANEYIRGNNIIKFRNRFWLKEVGTPIFRGCQREEIETIFISDRFEITAEGYLEVGEGINSADHSVI